MRASQEGMQVLHVDDDPEVTGLVAEVLEREIDGCEVVVEHGAAAGLERLDEVAIDCIVSDYEMPGRNGLEFLDAARSRHGDLPFVLFTGKGSEEIASEAISAGVTDYLRKRGGIETYELLANRVEGAVARHRAERDYREIFEKATDGIAVHDPGTGEILDANEQFCRMLGYDREELLELSIEDITADDDAYTQQRAERLIEAAATEGTQVFEWRNERADGTEYPVEVRLKGTTIGGTERVLAFVRDISERKRRQGQLERERDRFSALFENFPEPTVEYEYEDGEPVVRAVNGAFEDTFGIPAERAVGENIDDLVVPPDRAEEARELDRRVREGSRIDRELRRLTADGRRRFRFRNIEAPADSAADGFAVYADVTERRRTQQRLSAIIENVSQAIYIKDTDGVYELINPAGAAVFDESPEAVVGLTDEELFGSEKAAEIREKDREVMEERTSITYESTVEIDGEQRVLRNQKHPFVPDGDEVRGVLGISHDVTEEKEHRRTLEALNETARAMMGASNGDVVCDRAVAAAEEVIGLPHAGLHLVDDESGALEPVAWTDTVEEGPIGTPPVFEPGEGLAWRALDAGEPQRYPDLGGIDEAYNPDTELRSELHLPIGDRGVLISAATERAAFDDTDVQLGRILAATTEAALERADRERRLRESQRELKRQNDRLESFAEIVSHDLRNPLTVAQGHLEAAIGEYGPDERLDEVATSLDRMAALIEDLLALAREGRMVEDPQPCRIGSVARACWEDVETGAATLTVADDCEIRADPDRLRHVFENLFRNAVEHGSTSPPSQAQEDAVEHGSTSPRSQDPGDADDGAVTITVGAFDGGFYVADDGAGIPPEERNRVFDRGYTTSDEGTGLGLSIVREIVEAHGWTIDVTGAENGGARFEVRTEGGGAGGEPAPIGEDG